MSFRVKLWTIATNLYPAILRKVYGMDIGKGVRIAHKAHLDKSVNPQGVHIGDRTWILNGAFVMAHDHCRSLKTDTYIGHDCVIGVNSIIMPGVKIGNEVVIGSGSVVTKNIPDNCIAVGNPAKVIKTNIHVYNGKIQDV
jgi:acetyltransferase-like isoleucine patch superfamily enzyme